MTPRSPFGSWSSVTAQVSVSYKHGLDYNSWDALSCISWYRSSSALFFPIHSVLWCFPRVFTDSDLFSTQDRLSVCTVHLLSHNLSEHSQQWPRWMVGWLVGSLVGRTGGRAWGHGFHRPHQALHHMGITLPWPLSPPYTWWPQDH